MTASALTAGTTFAYRRKLMLSADAKLITTTSDMLIALNIGADDGRKTINLIWQRRQDMKIEITYNNGEKFTAYISNKTYENVMACLLNDTSVTIIHNIVKTEEKEQ